MAATLVRCVVILAATLATFLYFTSAQATDQDKCAGVECLPGQECRVVGPICRRCPNPQPKFPVCVNVTSG
ncbi:hypothetical protein J6590_002717 [Homalodisca vitripennis]|nr:hypothetical protein J6590_002717 [Homalodisca vitripennis]